MNINDIIKDLVVNPKEKKKPRDEILLVDNKTETMIIRVTF
jgi:hypothetical protein